MKSKKLIAFISALTLIGTAATGCSDSSTPEETTASTAAKELNDEDKAALEDVVVEGAEKLENPTVRWLATYDINPADGKPKMPELEMFENQYGGKIEFIQCTFDERYDRLATMLVGGSAPDMFPAQEFDTFPSRVLEGKFQAWDDYLDFNDEVLWANASGAKKLSDYHTLKGKHYVAAVGTYSQCVMIYNKNTIEENGLDDPVQLLEDGNWTWDTFRKMCADFHDREEGKFAYDSWYFERALLLTTGVSPVGMENGKLVNNLASPEIERAENFMYNLKKDDLPFPKAEYDWTEHAERIGEGKTLFLPIGTWALWGDPQYSEKFGNPGDIMFVPMPKDPDADAYYLPASMNAYALCTGAPNPEGAAAYMKCILTAGNSDVSKSITEKQYREDYGWTDEMIDMMHKVDEMTDENPVISIVGGLSGNIDKEGVAHDLDDALKQASFSGADWTSTRESIYDMAQADIDEFNNRIENEL